MLLYEFYIRISSRYSGMELLSPNMGCLLQKYLSQVIGGSLYNIAAQDMKNGQWMKSQEIIEDKDALCKTNKTLVHPDTW